MLYFTRLFDFGERVLLENGSHPLLYVEEQGHGVYAFDPKYLNRPFDDGDGVIYRVGDEAKAPTRIPGEGTYTLRSFQDEIWPHRAEVGPGKLFDQPMTYGKLQLGQTLDGDDHKKDAARPPWGWFKGPDFRLKKGDVFFRPAHTVRSSDCCHRCRLLALSKRSTIR